VSWLDVAWGKITLGGAMVLIHGAQMLNAGARQWLAGRRKPRWIFWLLLRSSQALGGCAGRLHQIEIKRRRAG